MLIIGSDVLLDFGHVATSNGVQFSSIVFFHPFCSSLPNNCIKAFHGIIMTAGVNLNNQLSFKIIS